MKHINLIIIDDERSARELLRQLLADMPEVHIQGEAGSVDEAFPMILKSRPDLLLLDIQMPGKDGFVLVEKLLQHGVNVELIFVTAHEMYAIRAIRASAFDYLLKPVKKKDLAASLSKFSKKVQYERMNDRFSQLMYQLNDKKKLKFRNRTGFVMIDPDEILFCQADSNYTVIELDSGKLLTVSMNLGKVEEMLPGLCFSRISRSVIVNLHYLAAVDRKNMTCDIVNQSRHTLHVSKKYLKELEADCDRHFSMHE